MAVKANVACPKCNTQGVYVCQQQSGTSVQRCNKCKQNFHIITKNGHVLGVK